MDRIPPGIPETIPEDLALNDACSVSFEVSPYAAFHFNPDTTWRISQKKRAFEGGLKRLAVLLKNKQDGKRLKNGKEIDARLGGVEYVSVTSWIVAKNGRILEAQGFSGDFGADEPDKGRLLAAYASRMHRLKLPMQEGVAMRMTTNDFIRTQLSDTSGNDVQ